MQNEAARQAPSTYGTTRMPYATESASTTISAARPFPAAAAPRVHDRVAVAEVVWQASDQAAREIRDAVEL